MRIKNVLIVFTDDDTLAADYIDITTNIVKVYKRQKDDAPMLVDVIPLTAISIIHIEELK